MPDGHSTMPDGRILAERDRTGDKTVYVVVYATDESTSVLWAGLGRERATEVVRQARAGIEEAVRARREILGDEPDYDSVTEAQWDELHRREGPFWWYEKPARVCVLKEVAPFEWECCCEELGLTLGSNISEASTGELGH